MDTIDERSEMFKNRSDFIEKAIRSYLAQIAREEQNARDLSIINKKRGRLNKEAEDVLGYQVIP
ncbi:hypothetical protein HYR69_02260 [Candidatus Sumerlaeota bacterium]|nr:hypothetical protein [Candidatus Sumerlaeota bacterium]MBI3736183.1 hypothetical protein [Candidatus Sumerlaeota bacterium]